MINSVCALGRFFFLSKLIISLFRLVFVCFQEPQNYVEGMHMTSLSAEVTADTLTERQRQRTVCVLPTVFDKLLRNGKSYLLLITPYKSNMFTLLITLCRKKLVTLLITLQYYFCNVTDFLKMHNLFNLFTSQNFIHFIGATLF